MYVGTADYYPAINYTVCNTASASGNGNNCKWSQNGIDTVHVGQPTPAFAIALSGAPNPWRENICTSANVASNNSLHYPAISTYKINRWYKLYSM